MTILITGASSGIGAELAKQYATKENNLILLARRMDKLLALKQKLLHRTKSITLIVADVREFDKLKKKLQKIEYVDIVILNAGISLGHDSKDFPPLQKVQNLFDVNLFANHAILEVLLPIMQKQKGEKKIVFISSLASLFSMPTSTIYSASKRALNSYAEGLRYAYKPYGIEVLSILPGFIKSELTDKNNFKMPFFLSTSRGVARIIYAIEQNKKFYPFPKRFYYLIVLLNLLPQFIRQKIIELF